MSDPFGPRRARDIRSGAPSPPNFDTCSLGVQEQVTAVLGLAHRSQVNPIEDQNETYERIDLGDRVITKFIFGSRMLDAVTSTEPQYEVFPTSTRSNDLFSIIRELISFRIKQSEDGTKVYLAIFVGNDTRKLSFLNTADLQLGEYPRNTKGEIVCEVDLASAESLDEESLIIAARGLVDTIVDTTEVDRAPGLRAPSAEMIPMTLYIKNCSSANRTITKTIKVKWNSTHQDLTEKIEDAISPFVPDYMRCLVLWRSKIGSEEYGYTHVLPGKTLPEYAHAVDENMAAKITFCLRRPTLDNLVNDDAEILTDLPTLLEFNNSMEKVAAEVGAQKGRRIRALERNSTKGHASSEDQIGGHADAEETNDYYERHRRVWNESLHQ